MRYLIVVLITFFVSQNVVYAQAEPRALARISAAKMAYITDRLQLSVEQSAKFVPIYRAYEDEVRRARKAVLGKYKGIKPEEADDETARQFIDDNLDYQQQVLDIKKQYKNKFLEVLTTQQLSDLNQAEREFRQLLLERLQQRRGGNRRRF